LNHHVDEWKSNHITLLVQDFTLTSGDCFPGIFASLPNVSSWPTAAESLAIQFGRERPILLKNSFRGTERQRSRNSTS